MIVQGGPGTGKTAVGLHRAAYLLFEHRRRLAREGVLVVGPNRVFLDYIANVLPSLGRALGAAAHDRRAGHAPGRGDGDDTRRGGPGEGSDRDGRRSSSAPHSPRSPCPPSRCASRSVPPSWWSRDDVASMDRGRPGRRPAAQPPPGGRCGRSPSRRCAGAPGGTRSGARSRPSGPRWPGRGPSCGPRPLVERLLSRPEVLAEAADGLLSRRRAARWSSPAPGGPSGGPPADQVLLDAANSLLNGPLATFGHVVVDEAQDLSALALAVVARRCPSGSLTILGDLAQSTGAAGQSSWADVIRFLGADASTAVEHLTIGYRVPAPILDVANRLLPATGVDVPASRSVRREGHPPSVRIAADPAAAAAEEVVDAAPAPRLTRRRSRPSDGWLRVADALAASRSRGGRAGAGPGRRRGAGPRLRAGQGPGARRRGRASTPTRSSTAPSAAPAWSTSR